MSAVVCLSVHAVAREVAAETSDPGRRAMALAMRYPNQEPELYRAARLAEVNRMAVTRANLVMRHAPDLADAVRRGDVAISTAWKEAKRRRDVGAQKVVRAATAAPAARIDANWVADRINEKLTASLAVICELPLASDVAEILRDHSASPELKERVKRAVTWLKELEHALDL